MTANENAAVYFVDRHVAEGRGGNVAFREAAGKRRDLTYGRLAERSDLVAGGLERLGIHPEQRIACLVLDQIEYPELFWGALKAQVVPIALNTLLTAETYDFILRDSRAVALFVSAELYDVVQPVLANNPVLRQVVVIGDTVPEGALSWDAMLSGASPRKAATVGEDECAFWLYSSGSTGQPKGVRHVHGALKATADTYGAQVLGIREDDVVYSVAKIFFAYGLGNAMTFPMSVGATTVLFHGRPLPEVAAGIIRDEKPSIFCGVPTLYAAMVHWLEKNGVPEHCLRCCISAGEALPEEVGRAWGKLWGGDILDGVGSTEMLHIFLSNRPGDVVYGTSGVAVPGYDLRCVDEEGTEIKPGGVGELLVRGASAAEGYWNKRSKSRTTFEGEWTRTGDKYEITEAGRFVYCGRTDDMFKVSGIWVSPFEVEQALVSHPGVLEAAVVPFRDADDLEKPKAFVVLKDGTEPAAVTAELKEFVKAKVGAWKYPRWVEVLDDLPKTATGKIQRFKLRGRAPCDDLHAADTKNAQKEGAA
ncbi:benzoate-CoA ligase family protein [Sagittula salina]|uniref:Benzoate-CoA ligase family protein n=1 Tax=Sagittula salina TaxID=2820268 RepID=A0A940MRL8_9RHOB|nr:benzoate-CoA ligase family protein [Sagittula salina]MBP0484119.1 benzoate-CoA ligase family protein [Sagittula salina]